MRGSETKRVLVSLLATTMVMASLVGCGKTVSKDYRQLLREIRQK